MSDQEGGLKPRSITLRTDAHEHSAPGKGRSVWISTIKYREKKRNIVRLMMKNSYIQISVP